MAAVAGRHWQAAARVAARLGVDGAHLRCDLAADALRGLIVVARVLAFIRVTDARRLISPRKLPHRRCRVGERAKPVALLVGDLDVGAAAPPALRWPQTSAGAPGGGRRP